MAPGALPQGPGTKSRADIRQLPPTKKEGAQGPRLTVEEQASGSRTGGDRGLNLGPSSAPKLFPKPLPTCGPGFLSCLASPSRVVLSTQYSVLFSNGQVLLTSSGSNSACLGPCWCVSALGVGMPHEGGWVRAALVQPVTISAALKDQGPGL